VTPANAGRLWHDERILQWARAVVGIVSDVLTLGILFLRSSNAIRAENLVLRRQLARYIERGIKPRRVDHATRVTLHHLFAARLASDPHYRNYRHLVRDGYDIFQPLSIKAKPTKSHEMIVASARHYQKGIV